MTKQEIIEALVAGSRATSSEYVNIKREHLLIALDALPESEIEDASNTEAADILGPPEA